MCACNWIGCRVVSGELKRQPEAWIIFFRHANEVYRKEKVLIIRLLKSSIWETLEPNSSPLG